MINWYQVLHYFERKGYNPNGLTIPFLVGCTTVISPDIATLSISELISEANEHGVSIKKCGDIGEFVIGTIDSETRALQSQYPALYRQVDNILLLDNTLPSVTSIAGLCDVLCELYCEFVDLKKYSWSAGKFNIYGYTDVTRLRELQDLNVHKPT